MKHEYVGASHCLDCATLAICSLVGENAGLRAQVAGLEERVRLLNEFASDLAMNGVRFDLNPTVRNNEPSEYVDYIRRIDTSVRERASAVKEPA